MRRTLTSAVALGIGLGLPALSLADTPELGMNGEEQERLEAAGFTGARILPGVEVARVTENGDTFYVVSGIGVAGGMDWGMDRADAGAAPGAMAGTDAADTELAGTDVVEEDDEATTLTAGQATADAVAAAEEAPAGMAAVDTPGIGTAAGDETAADDVAGTFDEPEDAETVGAGELAGEDAQAEVETAEIEADLEPGELAEGVERGLPLEQRLEEAGFEDYEILEDARIAEVSMGLEGGTVWVILGVDDEPES